MNPEQWRSVVGFPSYEVSSIGGVRRLAGTPRCARPRLIEPEVTRPGYLRVQLSEKTVVRHVFIHRLVAEAFIGVCPVDFQVNHINGCKSDNTVANLEYVSGSENVQHAIRLGLRGRRGALLDKLTPLDVREIRRLRSEGQPRKVVAALFGVSESNIKRITSGALWSHVQ